MTDAVSRRQPLLPVPAVFAIAGGFGLFYAYVVWNAITLLVAQATGPLGLNGIGWAVLIAAAAFPILVFAGGFALGWRRRAAPFAAILLCGLALVAVFWLNVLAYAYTAGADLLGG